MARAIKIQDRLVAEPHKKDEMVNTAMQNVRNSAARTAATTNRSPEGSRRWPPDSWSIPMASSVVEERLPAMWGSATEAMDVSSTSINAGRMTETAISHGLQSGHQSLKSARVFNRWRHFGLG